MTVTYYGGPSNCAHVELTEIPDVQPTEGGYYAYDGQGAYHFHVGDVPVKAADKAAVTETATVTTSASRPRTRTRKA